MATRLVLLLGALLALAVVAEAYSCNSRHDQCPKCVKHHVPGTFMKTVFRSQNTKCMFVSSLENPHLGRCVKFDATHLNQELAGDAPITEEQVTAFDVNSLDDPIVALRDAKNPGLILPGEETQPKCGGVHHCSGFANDCQGCTHFNHDHHRCFFVATLEDPSRGQCKPHSDEAVKQEELALGEEGRQRLSLPGENDKMKCPKINSLQNVNNFAHDLHIY